VKIEASGLRVLGRRAVGAPPASYLIRNRGRHRAQAAAHAPSRRLPARGPLPYPVNPTAMSLASDEPVLNDPIYTD